VGGIAAKVLTMPVSASSPDSADGTWVLASGRDACADDRRALASEAREFYYPDAP
jgi:hypothetical protein